MDRWKQSQGDSATYGKLIVAFESAGYQAYADFVRGLANDIEIPANNVGDDDCHLSPPISPETCIQSLFLTNTPDDNQNEQEGKTIVAIYRSLAKEGPLWIVRPSPSFASIFC